MAVFITAFALIVAVSVIILSHINFLTTKAFIDGKKDYYQAEGKLLLCMYKDEYFNNEIIPRIEHFIKYGNLRNYHDGNIIELDNEDLSEGDSVNKVNIDLFYENNDLKTKLIISIKENIMTQNIISIFNMINLFYRMELPILSRETVPTEKLLKFEKFCNELTNNIKVDEDIKDITPIEGDDFEKVSLKQDTKLEGYIAYIFKNGESEPCKEIPIVNNNLFLILKGKGNYKPKLEIYNNKGLSPVKGIIYVEGDIILYDNVEFYGIIVIENGTIIIKGEDKPVINGLVVLNDYNGNAELVDSLIKANYNKEYIYRNGPLLPNFFEPELELMKILR